MTGSDDWYPFMVFDPEKGNELPYTVWQNDQRHVHFATSREAVKFLETKSRQKEAYEGQDD